MTPAKLDLLVFQGATYVRELRIAADLTGCAARMQLREKAGGALMLDLGTASGGLVLVPGASLSVLTFTLTKAQTAALRCDAVYDLFIDYPNGTSQMLIYGSALLHKRVTQ